MQENLEQISETFLRDSIEKWSDDPTISEDKRREIVLTFNQANLIAKGYRLVCSAENEKELKEKEKILDESWKAGECLGYVCIPASTNLQQTKYLFYAK